MNTGSADRLCVTVKFNLILNCLSNRTDGCVCLPPGYLNLTVFIYSSTNNSFRILYLNYQPFSQHKEISSKHHDPYIFKHYDTISSFFFFISCSFYDL